MYRFLLFMNLSFQIDSSWIFGHFERKWLNWYAGQRIAFEVNACVVIDREWCTFKLWLLCSFVMWWREWLAKHEYELVSNGRDICIRCYPYYPLQQAYRQDVGSEAVEFFAAGESMLEELLIRWSLLVCRSDQELIVGSLAFLEVPFQCSKAVTRSSVYLVYFSDFFEVP